jgi:hypothetical protein
MAKNYGKLWSEMVGFIQSGDGDKAREIWDKVVEDAWKYNDLKD